MHTNETRVTVMVKEKSRCLTNGSTSGRPLDSLAFIGSICSKAGKLNPAQISRKRSRPREVKRTEDSSKGTTTRLKCSTRRQTRIRHEDDRCSSSLAIISSPATNKFNQGKGIQSSKHKDFNSKANSRIVTPIKSKRCPSDQARIKLQTRHNQSGSPITPTKGDNVLNSGLIHRELDKFPDTKSSYCKQIYAHTLHSDEELTPSRGSSHERHEKGAGRFVHYRVAVKTNHNLKFGSVLIYEEGFGLVTFDDGEEEVLDDDELFQAIELYRTHKMNHPAENISMTSVNNAASNKSQSESSKNQSTNGRKGHLSSSGICPPYKESVSSIVTVKEIKRHGKNRERSTILPILSQNECGTDLSKRKSETSTKLGVYSNHLLTSKSSSSKARCSSTTRKRRLERVGKYGMGKNKRLRLELASTVKCGKMVIPGRQLPRSKQKAKMGKISKAKTLWSEKRGKKLPDTKEKFVGLHPCLSTASNVLVERPRPTGPEALTLSNLLGSKEEGTSKFGIHDNNPLDSSPPPPPRNIHIETCQVSISQREDIRALSTINDFGGGNEKKKKTRGDAMLAFINTIEEDLRMLKKQIDMNRDDENIASVDDVMKNFISLTGKHIFRDNSERTKKPSKPCSTSRICHRVVPNSAHSLQPSSDKKITHNTISLALRKVPKAKTRMRNELAPPPLPLPKSRLSNWEDYGEITNQLISSKIPDSFFNSSREVYHDPEEDNSGLTRNLRHNNRLNTVAVSDHDRLLPKQSRCNIDSGILSTLGGSLSKPVSNRKMQREAVMAQDVHSFESSRSNHLLSSSITEGRNRNTVVTKNANDIFRSLLLKDKRSFIRESLETSGISQTMLSTSDEDDDENSTSATLLMDLPNYSCD